MSLAARPTRLYYVVRSEMLDGGVIEAQVVARLRSQARLLDGVETRLIFLEPARVAFGRAARATLDAYRAMWPDGDIAVVPFVSRVGEASAGRSLALYLSRQRFTTSPLVFHCRGAAATASADVARRLLGRGRVVFDLRGAGPYEEAHRFGSPWAVNLSPAAERAYQSALQQEQHAARRADFVLTVSDPMRDYARDVLGVPDDRILVTPSSVDDVTFDAGTRRRVRGHWGVAESTPVFAYAGRLGPERLPGHMFRLFASALRVRPDARLLLLLYRNDIDSLPAALAAAGIPSSSVTIACETRDDVVDQLSGADIGLFFCEPALRFRCALPIKFAEYLSAGLSLVVNSVATPVADLVRDRRLGWIVDEPLDRAALDDAVARLLAELSTGQPDARRRALACCSELFLWRRQLPAMRRAYALTDAACATAALPFAAAN